MSNNSLAAEVGTNYEDYVDLITDNGEPGFIWLDDLAITDAQETHPMAKTHELWDSTSCAEQPLESYELCTLVEVHINQHESKEDFLHSQVCLSLW